LSDNTPDMCMLTLLEFGSSQDLESRFDVSLLLSDLQGAVRKFPELWYSTVMVGHMTTLTQSPSK